MIAKDCNFTRRDSGFKYSSRVDHCSVTVELADTRGLEAESDISSYRPRFVLDTRMNTMLPYDCFLVVKAICTTRDALPLRNSA